jgi:hypothetical protein
LINLFGEITVLKSFLSNILSLASSSGFIWLMILVPLTKLMATQLNQLLGWLRFLPISSLVSAVDDLVSSSKTHVSALRKQLDVCSSFQHPSSFQIRVYGLLSTPSGGPNSLRHNDIMHVRIFSLRSAEGRAVVRCVYNDDSSLPSDWL